MAKRTSPRQSKSKSLGQTLNGILIGLILGAIIIAILLWFLNKQKMPIEPPKASEPTKTEIMVPNQAELPHTDPTPTASEGTGTLGTENTGAASELLEHEESESEKPVIVKPPQNKHEAGSKAQTGEKKPQTTPPVDKKPEGKSTDNKTSSKPTPEQILEHGSVEKARAANQKEAAKKQAEKAPAKEEAKASTGRSVKLQAGSFGSKEQAEAQRAKLALLGISAQVETGQVNGKPVHRVRTARLNEDKAAQVRKQLSNNGIDSIAVGAN